MPAEFRTRPGRIRPVLTGAIVVLALAAIVLSGLPWPVAGAGMALVAIAGYRAWRNTPEHSIRLAAAGGATLDGVAGSLVGDAVTGGFVSLRVVSPDGRVTRALIFRDEIDDEQFRALLAALRHG